MRPLKYRYPALSLLCSVLFAAPLSASIEAKTIGQNYQRGVVKILLYDPQLVSEFHLKVEQGYISRASGFFVTPEGVLFTNSHVIDFCVRGYLVLDWEDEAGRIHYADFIPYSAGIENDPAVRKIYYSGYAEPIVQVFDGDDPRFYELYRGQVLSLSKTFDGAMLRLTSDLKNQPLSGKNFLALPCGNSEEIVLGEDFVVLGYPSQYLNGKFKDELKDTITMTFGKHSGLDYVFDDVNGMIKTDAAIHEGNSGGPVFAENKKVIGIATAMGAKTRIGLVGGINYMYWVANPYPAILKELTKAGLRAPKDSAKIDTIMGDRQPLPSFHPGKMQGMKLKPKAFRGKITSSKKPVQKAEAAVLCYCEYLGDYLPVAHAYTDEHGNFTFELSLDPNTPYLLRVQTEEGKTFVRPLDTTQTHLKIALP